MSPRVHEYTADAQVAGPIDTRQARPIDTGDIGDAISKVGAAVTGIGEVMHKRDAQSEISSISAQIAQAHSDFSTGLDDTLQKADPNDRNISDNFMQDYDDRMDGIADNIQTPEAQRYFEKANAQMRDHFQVASAHGQSMLAGQSAVDNQQTQTDQYSASLMNDPSSFDSVKSLNSMSIQAMVDNGLVPAAKADELRGQAEGVLAKSAVRGWINLDPEGTKKQLESGKWDSYLTGDQKYQLQKEADQGINAKRIEANRQDVVAAQAIADKNETTENNWISKINGSGLSAQEVIKDPTMTPDKKNQYLRMIDTATRNQMKDDPDVVSSLWDRMHLPDGSPQKISDPSTLNQYVGNGLSLSTLQKYRLEMSGTKTPDGKIEQQVKTNFLKTVETQLTKPNAMGLKDPEGLKQYQGFLTQFLPEYQKQRAAGKTASQLLSPSSPDYMGKMADAFYRTPQQIMQSTADQMRSNPQGALAPSPTATQSAATPQGTSSTAGSRREVSDSELSAYAKKHSMDEKAARDFLKGQGYGVR